MRFGVQTAIFLALFSLFPANPAAAQSASAMIAPSEPDLRPGQFIWFDEPSYSKAGYSRDEAVSIVVSLAAQRAYIYRGGRLIGVSTVSTGSEGRETPTGEFTILQKKTFHRSNLYSNAPMPYMQRLTWDGIALHAGHLPGYPASHGCIRLPATFAKQLYGLTEMGGTVSVVDDLGLDPGAYAQPAPLLTADTGNLGGGAYDVVTMAGDAPAQSAGGPALAPVSWVLGPAKEVVQPVPSARRGSR